MIYPRRFLGIVLSLAVVNVGCGAMFNNSTTLVRVNVAPTGARVYVDGLYVAQAPGEVDLTNSESHSIELDANGYERQGTRIESQTSAGYVVLDCVLLVFFIVPGIIALVVDGSTGDWKVLDTDHITARLARSQPPQPPPVAPTTAPAAMTGCQYDAQCKGDRLCRDGECVAPTAPDTPAAPTVPEAPTAPPPHKYVDPFVQ
jgi:hypothetical protein